MTFRPVVHKNGTSRDALLEQLTDLMQALRDAEDALGRASPNGRDYYPLGHNALRDAQNKHREWAVALRKIYQEVEQAAEHVADQENAKMIEIAKLEKMVQAEVAADDWWRSLSPKERKAYLKAHPSSKYARAMTKTARDAHSGAEDVIGANASHVAKQLRRIGNFLGKGKHRSANMVYQELRKKHGGAIPNSVHDYFGGKAAPSKAPKKLDPARRAAIQRSMKDVRGE